MGVDHYFVVGLLHGIKIVVVGPLTEVVASGRNNLTNITALHSVVAVVLHKLIRFVHTALVVAYRA